MSDHEINSIESDEERVTVIPSHRRSQSRLSEGTRYSHIPRELCTSPTTTVPVHSVVNQSGVTSLQKVEAPKEEERYLSILEVNGRLMRFDTSPLKNEEGIFKIVEIVSFLNTKTIIYLSQNLKRFIFRNILSFLQLQVNNFRNTNKTWERY